MLNKTGLQWIFLSACLIVSGCAGDNHAADIDTVLRADPSFESVLKEHQHVLNRIETYNSEWQLKKAKVEQAIQTLQEELERAHADVERKSDELRASVVPQREEWEEALERANEELRDRKIQRGTLGRSVAKLRKIVRLAGEAWPEDERRRQEVQLEQMLEDVDRIEQEVLLLQEHVQLLKLKLELTEIPS